MYVNLPNRTNWTLRLHEYAYFTQVFTLDILTYKSWLYEKHDGCLIRDRNCCLPFASTSVHPRGLVFGVARLFRFMCCVFVLFVFVLCLLCPILSVSLDFLLLIAPSVFYYVHYTQSIWKIYQEIRMPKIYQEIRMPKIYQEIRMPKIYQEIRMPKIYQEIRMPKIKRWTKNVQGSWILLKYCSLDVRKLSNIKLRDENV